MLTVSPKVDGSILVFSVVNHPSCTFLLSSHLQHNCIAFEVQSCQSYIMLWEILPQMHLACNALLACKSIFGDAHLRMGIFLLSALLPTPSFRLTLFYASLWLQKSACPTLFLNTLQHHGSCMSMYQKNALVKPPSVAMSTSWVESNILGVADKCTALTI
jgi:hypothetical protein